MFVKKIIQVIKNYLFLDKKEKLENFTYFKSSNSAFALKRSLAIGIC